jgi:hypothetical protein
VLPAGPRPVEQLRVDPLVGGHGAGIELLAISDDGTAAVSQDSVGGTRLWPTLDGTREPIVLHLAISTSLSIGRESDGFVVASLDQGGGAELLRITRSGHVITHASVAPEPPIEAISVAPQGVLAIRADQTLAILAPSGELRARLEAPPRSRITYAVTRRGRTLVLFAHDGTTNGRWLAGTSWGTVTPDFQLDPGSVAMLSPNGTRLAIDFERAAYVLDVETGKIVDNFGSGMPVGFYDDDTLIQDTGGKLAWQKLSDKYNGRREETEDAVAPLAFGDGVIVSAHGASLVLHARERVVQLGYGLPDVAGMRVAGDHVLVMGAKQQAVDLDRSLAQRAPLELPDDSRVLTDLVPIDDRFVIATHTLGAKSWWTVAVLDLVNHKTWQTPQTALSRGEIRYEPSTRLLELTDSAASFLTPWDPVKQQFETWYRLEGGPQDVYPVDPRANDGLVAIALHPEGQRVEIAEIHGDDLKVGAPIRPRQHYWVDGYAAGVDQRARVYVVDLAALVVYEHGKEVARILEVGDLRVVAQPKGDYIALYGDQRIRLYDIHGGMLWQIAAPLAQRITWLGDELVVDFAGGIGKIDAATGALNKRVCGWSFGLSALSSNGDLSGDSICDAP